MTSQSSKPRSTSEGRSKGSSAAKKTSKASKSSMQASASMRSKNTSAASSPIRFNKNSSGNKSSNFTPEEEGQVMVVYQRVSCDPVLGTGRTKEQMFESTARILHEEKGFPLRPWKSIQKKYYAVQPHFNDFTAIVRRLDKRDGSGTYRSGTVREDDIKDAMKQWCAATADGRKKKPFKYLEAWRELDDPKFKGSGMSSRGKAAADLKPIKSRSAAKKEAHANKQSPGHLKTVPSAATSRAELLETVSAISGAFQDFVAAKTVPEASTSSRMTSAKQIMETLAGLDTLEKSDPLRYSAHVRMMRTKLLEELEGAILQADAPRFPDIQVTPPSGLTPQETPHETPQQHLRFDIDDTDSSGPVSLDSVGSGAAGRGKHPRSGAGPAAGGSSSGARPAAGGSSYKKPKVQADQDSASEKSGSISSHESDDDAGSPSNPDPTGNSKNNTPPQPQRSSSRISESCKKKSKTMTPLEELQHERDGVERELAKLNESNASKTMTGYFEVRIKALQAKIDKMREGN